MSTTTGSVNLTPPTQGTHQGVTAFQDRSSTATNVIQGNGNLNITGTIYTPGGSLSVKANSTATSNGIPTDKVGSQIITNTLAVSGNGGFSVNSSSATPIRTIQLVE